MGLRSILRSIVEGDTKSSSSEPAAIKPPRSPRPDRTMRWGQVQRAQARRRHTVWHRPKEWRKKKSDLVRVEHEEGKGA